MVGRIRAVPSTTPAYLGYELAVWRDQEQRAVIAVAAGRDGVYLFTEVSALDVIRERFPEGG